VGLLEALSADQVTAVTATDGPLAVIAGPGAGKTRVLTRRIAWRCREGHASADHTLVLTFSRRAAGELLTRLAGLGLPVGGRSGPGVTAGTFHAVALAELRRHRADRGRPPPVLLRRSTSLLGPALAAAAGFDPVPSEVRAVEDELRAARLAGRTPATYVPTGRWIPAPPEAVAAAWSAYVVAKRRGGVLDLDDLLADAAALLEDDADHRAAARWRHRHVYVDEYQDLNPAHLRLLRAWVGGRPDLCLVGDPDQAVYGFNGACAELFTRVREDWPGVRIVALAEDFRASPEIVAATEALRPGPAAPLSSPVSTPVPSVPSSRSSRRPPGAVPRLRGFAGEDAEAAEAAAVAAELLGHHGPGRGWSRMAVLARTNARLRVIATALDAAGVPWRLRGERSLADLPAVRDVLDAVAAGSPAADLAEADPGDPDRRDGPETRLLASALEEFLAWSPGGTVAGFRAWLDASGPSGGPDAGVDLATFHRAKGLEWDAVWVVGVEEGTVPIGSATAPATLAEEQRLLYVAMTRAGDELGVSWAGASSRWIAPLAAAVDALAACPGATEQRRRFARLRQQLWEAGATRTA